MESGGSNTGARPVIEFAEFRLDPQQRKLSRLDGTPLTLNSRAFDTLLALVERRGEVLSKHQLMDAVWPRAVVEENNLNQAISALRKTLGDSDTNRIILTVPGRGFCFVAEIRNVTVRNGSRGADNLAQETVDRPAVLASSIHKSEPASPVLLEPGAVCKQEECCSNGNTIKETPQKSPFIPDAANSVRKFPGLLWNRPAVVAFIAFIMVVAGLAAWIRKPAPDSIDAKSIAVLPFVNISDDPEQDYFSDGLTEELINKLSQLDDLVVTGRNSSFYFKGRDDELRDIGQQLGVAHLLQGSVRKAGNQLRITAQLMDVETNANLWSQNFDREIADIFTIQDEISAAVTMALSVALRAGELSQPGMTTSIEAYDEFLQARTLFNVFTAESVVDAIDHYERAVSLDPQFARAWFDMSLVYQNTRDLFPLETSATFPLRHDEALGRVRALTPQMPELKLTEANVLISQYRHVEAERIFLELTDEAANAAAARAYALFLQAVGRSKDSGVYIQQARRLEPLDLQARWQGASWHGALFHMEQGRSEEALAEIERGLGQEGYDQNLSGMKFSIALLDNDAQRALQALEQMPVPRPDEVNTARLWVNGDIDGAMALVRANIQNPDINTLRRATYAQFALAMSYPQTALDFFSAFPQIAPFVWLPYSSELRKLPDFRKYLKDRGFLDYWRATGNWGDYCRPVNDDFECS